MKIHRESCLKQEEEEVLSFDFSKSIRRLHTWKSIQYMHSNNIQMHRECTDYRLIQNYIWNKSRRVSHIPGTEISSLIIQIRRGRPCPTHVMPARWIEQSNRTTGRSSTCGSARPLLMQHHVQKTIREDRTLLFSNSNAPLACTTDSCPHVFLKLYRSS